MLSQEESRVITRLAFNKRNRWIAWRSGAVITAIGILPTVLLSALIASFQAGGKSAAALAMPDMHMTNLAVFWAFPILQASGLTGLVFAYVSMVLGLFQSGRTPAWFPFSYRQIDRFHRQLGLLILGLVAVHVVATVFDAMGDSWLTVLVPGAEASSWPSGAWGYDLGIAAMYLLVFTAPTFYLRRIIRADRWRFIHRVVLLFYVLSIWHALILGADVGFYGWIRPIMWLAQLPLLALCIWRLVEPRNSRRNLSPAQQILFKTMRYGLAGVSAVGMVIIFLLVVTGHSGFIPTV